MQGRLEVIAGPMFSGKSEELMRRLRRDQIAGREVMLFKPMIDDRYEEDHVVSHNGAKMKAISVAKSEDLFWQAYGISQVVGIDEVQFMDDGIVRAALDLVAENKKVIVSGLDMTFRQEPFARMPELMALAESVTKLTAVCHSCGEDASFTQRLIDGKAASFAGDTVKVGGLDSYEARCRNCFRSAP